MSNKIIHANASAPRSGSELLQCLLSQHKDIYGSSTSPLLEFWYGAQVNSQCIEVKSQPKSLMKEGFNSFLREGSIGYYSAITERPIIVDKSRGWIEFGELLFDVFPDSKVVSMVRPVSEILQSLDRVYLSHPGHPETRNLPKNQKARFDYWMSSDSSPLGLHLERLRMRDGKGEDDRFLYIPYRNLVDNTQSVMEDVFKHLGVPPIQVDVNNIVKIPIEDDSYFGIFGDHSVRPSIGYRDKDE